MKLKGFNISVETLAERMGAFASKVFGEEIELASVKFNKEKCGDSYTWELLIHFYVGSKYYRHKLSSEVWVNGKKISDLYCRQYVWVNCKWVEGIYIDPNSYKKPIKASVRKVVVG